MCVCLSTPLGFVSSGTENDSVTWESPNSQDLLIILPYESSDVSSKGYALLYIVPSSVFGPTKSV